MNIAWKAASADKEFMKQHPVLRRSKMDATLPTCVGSNSELRAIAEVYGSGMFRTIYK